MSSPTEQQKTVIKSDSLGCEKLIIMFFVQEVAFQERIDFAYEK